MAVSKDEARCARVLDAAAAVFLAHGFSAATTDMIQRQAGVSKTTVYACFPTKEAMFAAVIERQCARTAAAIRAIDPVPGDIGRTLTAIGAAYLDLVLSDEGVALYRVVVADAPRFPELGRRFYLTGPRVVTALVAERLAAAVEAGEIDVQAIGIEAAATLFTDMVRGAGQLERLTHPDARPSAAWIDQWVAAAVTTFLAAFGVDTFPRT